MRFASQETSLQNLLSGVVQRQARLINTDVYANAFKFDPSSMVSPHTDDQTSRPSFLGTRTDAMGPMIFERKYELDSLCAFLKVSRSYYAATNDTAPFDAAWVAAVQLVLSTMLSQQTSTANDPGSPRPPDPWPRTRPARSQNCPRSPNLIENLAAFKLREVDSLDFA